MNDSIYTDWSGYLCSLKISNCYCQTNTTVTSTKKRSKEKRRVKSASTVIVIDINEHCTIDIYDWQIEKSILLHDKHVNTRK